MNYEAYTLETLAQLGLPKLLKGCQYISSGIEYLLALDKQIIPESGMLYAFAAQKYFLEPTAIENSMRNAIQTIWNNKENPELMSQIFGFYNMDKRPCNMEFLMLLYNYVRWHFEETDTLCKLERLWHCHSGK